MYPVPVGAIAADYGLSRFKKVPGGSSLFGLVFLTCQQIRLKRVKASRVVNGFDLFLRMSLVHRINRQFRGTN